MPTEHVVAVVVTHNRRTLLAESLAALRGQSRPPDDIVVVDNASTDGTADLLAGAGNLVVVTSRVNTGGAGGFAIGIDRALDLGADAIWLMDDDTVPDSDALTALRDVRRRYVQPGAPSGVREPVVVASRVVWGGGPGTPDERMGRDHPMNTPRVKPGVRAAEREAAEAVGCYPIRSASFVSVLVDAAAVRASGLPVADYFLWNDDFEFTTRLLRGHVGVCCPSSRVVHKTVTFGTTDVAPGERFYYEVRNKTWLFTRSSGLSPAEKVVYAGSTVRRWGRALARSDDRRTLVRCLATGLRDGLVRSPRETRSVISEATRDPGGERG